MKKRIITMLMSVFVFLSVVPSMILTATAEGGVTVKLYYNREDGNYEGWDVWLWPVGGEGSGYSFADENGEMVATAEFAAGTEQVGYIVRKNNWEAKDVDKDQFIEITGVVSGTVNVYVKSGVEGAEVVLSDNAVSGVTVKSARADGDIINIEMTGVLTDGDKDKFKVFETGSDEISVSDIEVNDKNVKITLSAELVMEKKYKLAYDGIEFNIITPDFFSTDKFEKEYTYNGDDLGAVWTAEKTSFRLWAPTAKNVKLNLYKSGDSSVSDLIETIDMTADVNGTWTTEKSSDINGVYYTYTVEIGDTVNEACDPYAKATGVNGERAMVIDLSSTNPDGWDNDKNPNTELNVTDMSIYELHIRDFSFDASSGMKNKGKYLAFTETGTVNSNGSPTGVDYLKDLGITHLHILPAYDYGSVDETKLDTDQFNWGYDPKNYNVPEGSYSTDPYNGEVRINEFKQMVQSLHNNGISVVMDVVYNHTFNLDFCFNKIVPGYFYRITDTGAYSSGSGCGNDVASERAMVKKYIVESVLYWAEEYHVDGFRFDLVGLIDTETINEIAAEINKIDSSVILYGEGWTMNTYLTKNNVTLSTQVNSDKVNDFAFFSDNIRDAIKGSVFDAKDKGYVNGNGGKTEEIKKAVLGLPSWAKNPSQVVNYTSCHDNLTLWDKIASSNPDDSFEDRVKQNKLAAAILFTSQGIPFIHAGEEMLRTKINEDGTFNENSYSSSSALNSIKWDDLNKNDYKLVHEYYSGLISFRSKNPSLRMMTGAETTSAISFIDGTDENVIAYTIESNLQNNMAVIYNPNSTATEVTFPAGKWDIYIDDAKAGNEILNSVSGKTTVNPISCMVLVQRETSDAADDTSVIDAVKNIEESAKPENSTEKSNSGLIIALTAGVIALTGVIIAFIILKKKKNK